MPQLKLTPKQIIELKVVINPIEAYETMNYCKKMLNITKKQTTKEQLKNKIAFCQTILYYAVKCGEIEIKF